MTPLLVDHLRYVSSRAYRREVNAALRRLMSDNPRGRSRVTVVHGDGCCSIEDWPTTYRRLLRSLAEDGERIIGVAPGSVSADVMTIDEVHP